MNGRRPTPIFATNFVSEERDLALRGFLSPLGSRARQRLTAEDLREIDEALATIDIKGAPLSPALNAAIDR